MYRFLTSYIKYLSERVSREVYKDATKVWLDFLAMLLVDINGVRLTKVLTSHRGVKVPSGSVGWCILPIFWLYNFTDFQNTVINRALTGESGPIDWDCRVIFMQFFKVTSVKRTMGCNHIYLLSINCHNWLQFHALYLDIVTFHKSWIISILTILIINILISVLW